MLRLLLVAALGLFLGLPIYGDDVVGGGDMGVWILPCSRDVATQSLNQGCYVQSPPRASRTVPTTSSGVTMRMPPEMSTPVVQLIDPATGLPLPVNVTGNLVQIPPRTLRIMYANRQNGAVYGLIEDRNMRGFQLTVTFVPGNVVIGVQ